MEKIIVLLIFLGAFLLFLFQSAPSDRTALMDFSFEKITLPVTGHIVSDPSGYYTSSRNEENVRKLFEGVNRIWEQANIHFEIAEILETHLEANAVPAAINGNTDGLLENKNYDKKRINVFFVQSLNGINGIALPEINSVLVADTTTVNDYRATAHELGHLLGLRHVEDSGSLLARGKNGEKLAQEEMLRARDVSRRFLEAVQRI